MANIEARFQRQKSMDLGSRLRKIQTVLLDYKSPLLKLVEVLHSIIKRILQGEETAMDQT